MHKTPKIYFISGVSGVGKSSVMKDLKNLLPADKFDIRDFDERGVPDGGGSVWHSKETLHWLDVSAANAKEGKSTIVCGFSEPGIVRNVHGANHPPFDVVLLHASGDTIRQRLIGRYPTAESIKEINRASGTSLDKFVENCTSYAPKLRKLFEQESCLVIDTDNKLPAEVAGEIVAYVKHEDS